MKTAYSSLHAMYSLYGGFSVAIFASSSVSWVPKVSSSMAFATRVLIKDTRAGHPTLLPVRWRAFHKLLFWNSVYLKV